MSISIRMRSCNLYYIFALSLCLSIRGRSRFQSKVLRPHRVAVTVMAVTVVIEVFIYKCTISVRRAGIRRYGVAREKLSFNDRVACSDAVTYIWQVPRRYLTWLFDRDRTKSIETAATSVYARICLRFVINFVLNFITTPVKE
jgi:hypothetical protein